MSETCEFSMVN